MSLTAKDRARLDTCLELAKRADELYAKQRDHLAGGHRAEIANYLDQLASVPELRAQISAIQARVAARPGMSEADKIRLVLNDGVAAVEAEIESRKSQAVKARHRVLKNGDST